MAIDKETEEKKNQRALAYKEERRKSGRYDKIQKTNKNTAIDLGNVLPYVNKVLVPNAASMVQQKQPVTQMASSAGNKAKKIQQKAQPISNSIQIAKPASDALQSTIKVPGGLATEQSTVIGAMEAMTGRPAGYANRAADGLRQWKTDQQKLQQERNTPGYQQFIEHMAKNNAAGTVEGTAAIPYLLGVDNSQYEPRSEWTVAERNEFGYLYAKGPQAAKEYAKSVNDRHKQENEEKAIRWIKQNQGPAAYGLLVIDQLGLAETLNAELTYVRDGQLPYTTKVTPSRFSELAHKVIEEDAYDKSKVDGRLTNAFAAAANEAYYSYLQKLGGNVFSAAAGATVDYSNGFNSALYDAKACGLSDAEALEYARRSGKRNAAGSLASDYLGNHLPKTKSVKDSMMRESVSSVVGGGVSNLLGIKSKYNSLVQAYTNRSMSKEEAERLATREIIKEIGSDAWGDLLSGAAYGWGASDNELTRSLLKR